MPSPLLEVAPGGHLLRQRGGAPFFWLGDTAWCLFHALTAGQAREYLADRAAKGFNAVQAVALSELDGLRTPNAGGAYALHKTPQGLYDPTRPVEAYWRHIEAVLDMAEQLGLYVALLPTWGDKFNARAPREGPEVFTPQNAHAFGLWLGRRLGHREGLVWVLGGDRPLETPRHRAIVAAMARGLRQGEAHRHLMTFHPPGNASSSAYLPELWDFHMLQSGHALDCYCNYQPVAAHYARTPPRPVLDGEPRYEDIPRGFAAENGHYTAAEVRNAAWWAVLSGALGHTYGHSSVWCMRTQTSAYYPYTWREALNRPAAGQMQHLKHFVERYADETRRPAPWLVRQPADPRAHVAVLHGEGYALFYIPTGRPLAIPGGANGFPTSPSSAIWFSPRSGHFAAAAIPPPQNGYMIFTPPVQGVDWALALWV